MANTYTLINSTSLSSSAASVTFSAIPATYDDIVIVTSTRDTNATANSGRTLLTVNGDTSTNYSWTDVYGFGTTVGSDRATSSTSIDPNQSSGDAAGNTASTFSSIEFYIPKYTSTSNRPVGISQATETNATSAWLSGVAGLYRGSSAITSVTLTARGNFEIGSTFWLYGIKNS